MSLKILNAIKEAEERAEQIKQQAASTAREIIAGAQAAVDANEKQAAADLRAEAIAFLAQQNEIVRCEIDKMAESAAGERAQACEAAKRRLEAVSAVIFERIIG